MTPNQTVAHHLRSARELRGMTQRRAAEAVSSHAGTTWSPESYAQAERAAHGQRSRRFDADELSAFARAFDLPVTYFLGFNETVLVEPAELDLLAGKLRELEAAQHATAAELGSLATTFAVTAKVARDEAAGEHKQPATVEKWS